MIIKILGNAVRFGGLLVAGVGILYFDGSWIFLASLIFFGFYLNALGDFLGYVE